MRKSLHLSTLALSAAALLMAAPAWADDETETLLRATFGTSPSGWTSIDNSPQSGVTWTWKDGSYSAPSNYAYTPCVRLGTDWSSTHDDYYVSPALELKAGQTYKVKTLVGTSYNEAYQCVTTYLEVGTARRASAFTEVAKLTTVKANNAGDFDEMGETNELTVSEDGTYYLAFHGVQEDDNQLWGFLLGMEVTKAPATDGISSVDAAAATAVYSRAGSRLLAPEGAAVSVFSANGAQAFSTKSTGAAIDLSMLTGGIYMVKVTDTTGQTKVLKIVK